MNRCEIEDELLVAHYEKSSLQGEIDKARRANPNTQHGRIMRATLPRLESEMRALEKKIARLENLLKKGQ